MARSQQHTIGSPSRIARRRYRRWRYDAMTATVSSRAELATYHVQDVSAGGALLTDGPVIGVGDTLEIVLRVRSHVIARLMATVVRHQRVGARGVGLGVAFIHDTDATEDALQDAALSDLERRARPAALIVSRSPDAPEAIAMPLERLGVPVLIAPAPLDALATIVDAAATLRAVVADAQLGAGNAVELLGVVAELAPEIRRVLASRSAAQLDGRAGSTAHATLQVPATADRFRAALSLV